MDKEARLARAFAAPLAPKRDPGFTYAVMRAAERTRYRTATAQAMLRWVGFSVAGAGLAAILMGSIGANPEALQNGALTAGAVFTLVWGARYLGRRSAAVFAR